jgi:hypothetical protein
MGVPGAAQAREVGVHDVREFYNSQQFRGNRFTLDAARRAITLAL